MADKLLITGYFEDESLLLKAIQLLNDKKVNIRDVFTPFPVHGLEKALGYRRSWIPRGGFIGGAIGAVCGFGFQAWVFTSAYPLNFGGKPFLSAPSFIPVTFECTILFAAFSMLFAFLFRSHLGPGASNPVFDPRTTDDRFLIAIDPSNPQNEGLNIKQILSDTGALGIIENSNYGTTI